MEHFLSVARISYLMVLEKNLDIPKDIIYATAFLHDMGRADQYEKEFHMMRQVQFLQKRF